MDANVDNPFQRLRVRWVPLWTLLGILIGAILLAIVNASLRDLLDEVTTTNLLGIFLYVWIWVWIYRKSKSPGIRLDLMFRREAPIRLRTCLGFAIVFYLFAAGSVWIIYGPLSYLLPGFVDSWVLSQLRDSSGDSRFPILNQILDSLMTVVIAPVTEEVFFRGILFNRWATKWGLRAGLIASSAAFALLHVDLLGSFIFAIILCSLYRQTRTLAAPIFVHVLYNALVLLSRMIDNFFNAGPVDYTLDDFRAQGWSSIVLLLISLPLVVTYLWHNWPKPGLRPPYHVEYIRIHDAELVAEA